MFNFVASHKTIQKIKKGSKYFKPNLGMSFTVDDKKGRVLRFNDSDTFSKFFYEKTSRMPYAQGEIGTINFFVDHYITDHLVLCYYNNEEIAFEFIDQTAEQKGIDAYLGSMIKKVESIYTEEVVEKKENATKAEIEKMPGDPNKVFTSPGTATYEDVKAYLRSKKGM